MKLNRMFIVSVLLLAILAIGAVSASEVISDDVSAAEPSDEVISSHVDDMVASEPNDEVIADQNDDSLEKTDSQAEILEENDEFDVKVYDKIVVDAPDYFYNANFYKDSLVNITNHGSKVGNIVILLNDTECYNKPMESDSVCIKVNELNPIKFGEVHMVVKFVSDEEDLNLYDGTNIIDYFIGMKEPGIYQEIYAFHPHSTFTFTALLPKDATGDLIFYDSVQNHTLEFADGKATYTLNGTVFNELGTNNVTISLINDPIYPNKTVIYYVYLTPMVSFPYYISEGEIGVVNLDFLDSFEGNILIYNMTETSEKGELILNESFKGMAQISFPAMGEGTHSFIYEITGYPEGSATVPCIKNQEGVNANVDSNIIELGSDAMLRISVPNSTYELEIWVDGECEWYAQYGNTSYTYSFSGLGLGGHAIKVLVYGEDGIAYSNTFTLTVKEKAQPVTVPAKIVAKDYSAYYNKGTYSVTVYGTDGKVAKGASVVFNINGKKVATVKTNDKGVAKVKISKYVPKTYKISATALGKTVTKKLTVKQVLTLKKVTVKRSAKSLAITATLKEGKKAIKGKKITFKFNGEKYTAKTNKKGIAKITIKKAVLKKLKAGKKLTYQATYIQDTVKKTVKVKK